jgi:hypothetical protein
VELVVAVHAEKHAFIEFLPEISSAPVVAPGEDESFRLAIDVMEAK